MNTKYYEIIDLDYEIRGMCVLESHNSLLTCSSKHRCLTLFDKKLKITRTIETIDAKPIVPRYIATNSRDKIFIVQSTLNKVTITDFEINFLKEVGTKGSECGQFDCPLGICCYEQSVYVCDSLNKRIQKLNENLEYEDSFVVNYKPWEIKISNDYACIRPNDLENIFFYCLESFKLIKVLSEGNGIIFCSTFWFYELSLNKYITCYDLTGRFVDRCNIDVLKEIDIGDGQVAMEYFNGNLILSCKLAKKLILLG